MEQPHMAQRGPFPETLEAGTTVLWCRCGRSRSQPFCDGSHAGTSFTPLAYTAPATGTVYFCGCKASLRGALCDGTHKRL